MVFTLKVLNTQYDFESRFYRKSRILGILIRAEMSEFQSRLHLKSTKEGRIQFTEPSNKFLRPRSVTKT